MIHRNAFRSAALALVFAASAIAQDKPAVDLSGAYTAHGTGVNGGKYEAKVTLTRNGDTYLIRWSFADSDFTGVGILRGDTLSVGWSNHDKAGVVVYTVKDDGKTLDGVWADGSDNGHVYTETLTHN